MDAIRADQRTTIAAQRALLIALVNRKDELLTELYAAKMGMEMIRMGYPAKATLEMVEAMELQESYGADFPMEVLLNAALAAAPRDDRDEKIKELKLTAEAYYQLTKAHDDLKSKCPPDDVLIALRHVCMWDDDVPLKPLIDAWNAWKNGKERVIDDCESCKHGDVHVGLSPCRDCRQASDLSSVSNWEPKE